MFFFLRNQSQKIFFVALILTSNSSCGLTQERPCKEIIGYYPGWRWYARNKLVNPKTIDYSNYTIINYAFFRPEADGSIIGVDSFAETTILKGETNWSTNPISYYSNTSLVDLAHSHEVKVLISVGGWTLSGNFSAIAADPVKRKAFARSCRDLIAKYNLDGIDIDWEFPGLSSGGKNISDKHNFTLLLQNVRYALNDYGLSTGKNYLLNIAAGPSPEDMEQIEWEAVASVVDVVSLMAYDYLSGVDTLAHFSAPLYMPLRGDAALNVDAAVKALTLTYGVSPEKICLGVSFRGRMVQTKDAPELYGLLNPNILNAPEDSVQPPFYKIVADKNQYDEHWDDIAKSPYLTGKSGSKNFITYENERSVGFKARYVIGQKLRGAVIWDMTADYSEQSPGFGSISSTPLVNTIRQIFCK